MDKICIRCGKSKDISEFYVHAKMKDGHLNKCKECAKKDSIQRRVNNIERIREYDRNRPNSKERALKNKKREKIKRDKNPSEYTIKRRDVNRRYRERNRVMSRARDAVQYALNKGKITKPLYCECCFRKTDIEAHHEDHTKPLEIIWLCDSCHKEADKKRRARIRRPL